MKRDVSIGEIIFPFPSFSYTFNGKEKDDETDLQDYGFRIYNGRLGRFLSIDPLAKKFPFLTPFQFASNTPIWGIDLDGKEVQTATTNKQNAPTRVHESLPSQAHIITPEAMKNIVSSQTAQGKSAFEVVDGNKKTNYVFVPTGQQVSDPNGGGGTLPEGQYWAIPSTLVEPQNAPNDPTNSNTPLTTVSQTTVQQVSPRIGGQSQATPVYTAANGTTQGNSNVPLRQGEIALLQAQDAANPNIANSNYTINVQFNPAATPAFKQNVINSYTTSGFNAVDVGNINPGSPAPPWLTPGNTPVFITTVTYTQVQLQQGVWVEQYH